jgi:hypothetical protein
VTTKNWNRFLIGIVIALVSLFMWVKTIKVRQQYSLRDYELLNPLQLALEFESPLWKFEELVKANPAWVTYRQEHHFPDADDVMPVMAGCALSGYTNHIQILLRHGADADEAINWLKQNGGAEKEIRIIREQIQQWHEVNAIESPQATNELNR